MSLGNSVGLSFFHSLLKSQLETKTLQSPLLIFRQLLQSDLKPYDFSFSLLIKASASSSSASYSLKPKLEANQIHTHLLKSDIPDRDVVAWNALISGYSKNGLELVFQGKSIHGFGVKVGLDVDSKVKNVLTLMYAKCGDLEGSEILFEEMVEKGVDSWNTMIGAYGKNGIVNDASAITSLVCVYARCGDSESAELLHKSLPQENLVSLTAIISSYAEKGNIDMLVACFARSQQLNMELDALAMVSILHVVKNPAYIDIGLVFHGYGIKTGLCIHNLVANGLLSMYSKFNDIEAVFSLFSEMRKKPLISWNSIISGCVQAGRADGAMELFCQMTTYGHHPDGITIASLLSGCSQLGYLQFGKKLHSFALRNNLEVENFIATALIDMYIKCGSIELAERVFNSIKEPCLATWNTIITGYGICGFENKALTLYAELRERGLKLDKITFLGGFWLLVSMEAVLKKEEDTSRL
ncbi:hypothetical protein DITRI_Ditri10aG0042300 [Diplodiscus trichospermus]